MPIAHNHIPFPVSFHNLITVPLHLPLIIPMPTSLTLLPSPFTPTPTTPPPTPILTPPITPLPIIPLPIISLSLTPTPLRIHQPQRLLQNTKLPLQHLRPVLHIPNLLHLARMRLRQAAQPCVLPRQRVRRPRYLPLLPLDGCVVGVELRGARAQLAVELVADGGEDRVAGLGDFGGLGGGLL